MRLRRGVARQLRALLPPAPTFTAVANAEALEITAVKATGAISKCFAPHAMKLRVELPGRNNLRSVVVPAGLPLHERYEAGDSPARFLADHAGALEQPWRPA
jgi:hypothetical protein